MEKKYTESEKLLLFEQATMKNRQVSETIVFSENTKKSITLPKSRCLARILLFLRGTFTLTHASKTTYTAKTFDKYHLLKSVRLSLNSGFAPYQLSGVELKMYNSINEYKEISDSRDVSDYITNTVSSAGATNTVSFCLELPITVNKRDMFGLIDMQQSGINVEIETVMGSISDIMTDTDISASNISISVTPVLETFSIPPLMEHMPEFNSLKIVSSIRSSVSSTGDITIKLPIGLTYRKIALYMKEDSNYTPISLSRLGNFSIILNQADYPYIVPAYDVVHENTNQHGKNLVDGLYVFDFSDNGIVNYGTGRDYMDSKNLSEMWVRVNFASLNGSANEIIAITEQLAVI